LFPKSESLARSAPSFRALRNVAVLVCVAATPAAAAWPTHAGNAQHTALSTVPAQPLQAIKWQAPVDLAPQYSGGSLLTHYGTPLVTEGNTVLFPVKTGVAGGFRVEARRAADGALRWQFDTDYTLPPHSWVPSVTPVITPQGRYYVPAAGGTLLWTSALDAPGPHAPTRVAFFGDAAYAANAPAMDASLRISTPITSAADGTLYFGIRAVASNPLGIVNGLASLRPDGIGRFVTAAAASGGLATEIAMNCAPALSADGALVYIAARGVSSSPGYLLALRTADLTLRAIAAPLDPVSGQGATISSNGTSSPMVAPDGRVFFGMLGTPGGSNASRGWLMQFDSLLVSTGAPGAFGWDVTPSLVPLSMVPSYAGSAPYLIMDKYNFYAGFGAGDGVNKLAILDPDATRLDPISGATVMNEVRVIAGVTPDPDAGPSFPNAVLEWCVNTSVVDPYTGSVLVASEDGHLYRWSLESNSFTESLEIATELGQAYTPSLIGPDGQVYTIHNSTLYAVGSTVVHVSPPVTKAGTKLARPQPNPFTRGTLLRFDLAQAGSATLDVVDVAGQHVVTLWSGETAAGVHSVRWDGRDEHGTTRPVGVYFVKLTFGKNVHSQKLLLVR
jgi:hypothetical protein